MKPKEPHSLYIHPWARINPLIVWLYVLLGEKKILWLWWVWDNNYIYTFTLGGIHMISMIILIPYIKPPAAQWQVIFKATLFHPLSTIIGTKQFYLRDDAPSINTPLLLDWFCFLLIQLSEVFYLIDQVQSQGHSLLRPYKATRATSVFLIIRPCRKFPPGRVCMILVSVYLGARPCTTYLLFEIHPVFSHSHFLTPTLLIHHQRFTSHK
jgi:hypothetical protein